MSRSAEVIMHLLLSIVVAIGFAVVVVLGALRVIRDLLALTKHRPPSIFDALREDDQESEDRYRRSTSPYAVDAQASRTIATNINAAHWPPEWEKYIMNRYAQVLTASALAYTAQASAAAKWAREGQYQRFRFARGRKAQAAVEDLIFDEWQSCWWSRIR
jgi:hypothetical protein